MPDFAELSQLAQLCNVAYGDNAEKRAAAAEALGLPVVASYETEDHQAIICRATDGRNILAISGTRFSDGNLAELFDDAFVLPSFANPDVMAGFHRGNAELYRWALKTVVTRIDTITGHSLGGSRAHLAPLWLPSDSIGKIVSFGAPKAATEAYWVRFTTPLTRVVHGRDLWAGWPLLPPWTQPEPMLWLHSGQAVEYTEKQWPGGLLPSDHSITAGYCRSLAALASAPPFGAH
jgi:hypothetical protein